MTTTRVPPLASVRTLDYVEPIAPRALLRPEAAERCRPLVDPAAAALNQALCARSDCWWG